MSNLALAKSEMFGSVQCDFYQDAQNQIVMTSEQLGTSLEYTNPRESINKLVSRNPYLRNPDFSVEVKLTSTDSKTYETRVFTEDGIYEVTMLARTKKAREFRAWVRKVLKELRSGELSPQLQTHIQALQQAQNDLLKITEDIKHEYVELRDRLETTEYRTENITIDSYCQKQIQQAVKEKITSLPGNRFENRKLTQALYKCIRFKFEIPSFRDVRVADYGAVMGYIQKWRLGN